MTQYSSRNSWNVNFPEGNVNNNNRYNSNSVRAVSDYGVKEVFPEVTLESIMDAELSCRVHKRGTNNERFYEVNATKNNIALWKDIVSGKYKIGRSLAFLVKQPVLREVFAGSYRDRIVHHWICMRLNPLFEEYLSDRMTSNRKDKGTGCAVNQVAKDIIEVSEGYTNDCYIYKFDLQGFFMSIDKRILNRMLQEFINERYKDNDIKALKWLVEMVVMHCPQGSCVFHSPKIEWNDLPTNKSLFYQDEYHGLAIGNLTSQLFANFYLKPFVDCVAEDFPNITQYVDDMVIVCKDKTKLLQKIPNFREYLKGMNVTLHPRKSYIQHYTKGVAFVGAIIKPHRIYPSKRMRERMLCLPRRNIPTDRLVYSVQSYLGLASQYQAYRMRRRLAEEITSLCGDKIIFDKDYLKTKLNITHIT